MQTKKVAISPTRDENFAEWYQQAIKAADMAEHSPVRGCMTIKPWGWAIWERIRDWLDVRIKATGHQNAYFPFFVPLSLLEKEASHVEGFAKECAVVTHHRLEAKDGKLIPVCELEEPLVARPTSEAVIGEAFSRWISSWRDLPLKINQWANIVRWEMRPRLFLRTCEFLWQEGHTAHATEKEAWEETTMMLEEYRRLMEDILCIPVIAGKKSPGERFPGAVETLSLESMTQDRKAIQCCTSHYMGQNFGRAFDIRFNTPESTTDYAYTTSWGVTTRAIGAMIMTHGDDNGIILPPFVAPYQIVIVPVLTQDERAAEVLEYCHALCSRFETSLYQNEAIRVHVDDREMRAGEKKWAWIKKGVPIRVEIGPRELDAKLCMVGVRDQDEIHKMVVEELVREAPKMLIDFHDRLFKRAQTFQWDNTRTDIASLDEMKEFFTSSEGGFVRAKWCGDSATEEWLKEFQATIRCLPFEHDPSPDRCVLTGRPATCEAVFAKAY